MDIQFVDTKIQTVSIKSLKIGEVFLTNDGMSDVCINLGVNNEGEYHYLIVGECPEICWVDEEDFQVRPVKSKLIVEI